MAYYNSYGLWLSEQLLITVMIAAYMKHLWLIAAYWSTIDLGSWWILQQMINDQ